MKCNIIPNPQFSSNKACFNNTEVMGGSFAILHNEIKRLPIYQEFIAHDYKEVTVSPTVDHIIKNTHELREELDKLCFKLTEDYHECNDPVNCQEWEKHPPCLVTQVSFRGGKVRPLTMFMPEINYLASKMKNVFKTCLEQNVTTDLITNSKYYYQEIRKDYQDGNWLHSGDLRSCTNLMDPRLSREVLWDVWTYVTGDNSPVYRRILVLAFSYYRLYREDDELHDLRLHAKIPFKRLRVNAWIAKSEFIKQLNGQHMGMSLSFWIMGVMHALNTNFIYRTPIPSATSTDLYNINAGKGIHVNKVGTEVFYFNKTLRNRPLKPGSVRAFGDDSLHNTPELQNILLYRELMKAWNQEWSTKGDFITKEGCVFTERVLIRKGDTLLPLINIKSKILFPELDSKKPYPLETLKSLDSIFDNEYDLKFLLNLGYKPLKTLNLARKIIFSKFRNALKGSKIPIHLSPKYGGLGVQGKLKKWEFHYLAMLSNSVGSDSFDRHYKAFKRDCSPKLTEVKRNYVKLIKVHEGTNYYPKKLVQERLYSITGLSENLINERTRVLKHINLSDYKNSYKRFYDKLRINTFGENKNIKLLRLERNLGVNKKIGIDDCLESVLALNKSKNFYKLSSNFRKSDITYLRKLIYPASPETFEQMYKLLFIRLKSLFRLDYIKKQRPEQPPYEYKKSQKWWSEEDLMLPWQCVVIGIQDNGFIDFSVPEEKLDWEYIIIRRRKIFFKIFATPIDKLNTKQTNLIQTLLLIKRSDLRELKEIRDRELVCLETVAKPISYTKYHYPQIQEISWNDKKIQSITLVGENHLKLGIRKLTVKKAYPEILQALSEIGALTAKHDCIMVAPVLWKSEYTVNFNYEFIFNHQGQIQFANPLMFEIYHRIFTNDGPYCKQFYNYYISGTTITNNYTKIIASIIPYYKYDYLRLHYFYIYNYTLFPGIHTNEVAQVIQIIPTTQRKLPNRRDRRIVNIEKAFANFQLNYR